MTYVSHSQENRNIKECLDERQALNAFIQTPSVQPCQEYTEKDLPITSTAVREIRMARRSTRLATRMSLHKAMFSNLSPEIRPHPEVTTCMNESGHPSFMGDVTVVQANTTVIESSVHNSFSSGTSLKYETDEVLVKQDINTVNRDEQNSKPGKNYRRRSSRLEALNATQKNQVILQDQSPFSSTAKKRRSYSTKNVSRKF